ncbi:pyruvate kinase alpha/beta domain-containing protein, partial [Paracoccaceae bacterium]|nr:pyruvate kinase alpha/beta domain-containing protein [Paracoccaceae bacterium]
WGTNTLMSGSKQRFKEAVVSAVRGALSEGYAAENDQIVITAGVPFNIPGTTNILRVAPCNERMIYSMDPE